MLQQQQKHNLSQTPFFWVAPSLISRDMTFQSACAELIEILILVWDLEIGKCWIFTQSVSQLYTERCLPIQPMWCPIINQTPKLKNVFAIATCIYLNCKMYLNELQNEFVWIAAMGSDPASVMPDHQSDPCCSSSPCTATTWSSIWPQGRVTGVY